MITKILVALDGSEPAARALALAADLAMKYGATLHLVHVVAHITPSRELREFARIEHIDLPVALEMTGIGESILAAARAGAATRGVQQVQADVLTGDPAEQLLGYAGDHKVDLVVMGRRGVGPIRGLLMGSVSSKVSGLADCPVLTVR
jgi:nucleotide-binding universal stress UspA family protein